MHEQNWLMLRVKHLREPENVTSAWSAKRAVISDDAAAVLNGHSISVINHECYRCAHYYEASLPINLIPLCLPLTTIILHASLCTRRSSTARPMLPEATRLLDAIHQTLSTRILSWLWQFIGPIRRKFSTISIGQNLSFCTLVKIGILNFHLYPILNLFSTDIFLSLPIACSCRVR